MEEYDQSGDKSPYFGSTVGRVANRIRDSVFTLPDKLTHKVEASCEKDHLHGGYGWHRRQWTVVQVLLDQNSVTLDTCLRMKTSNFQERLKQRRHINLYKIRLKEAG